MTLPGHKPLSAPDWGSSGVVAVEFAILAPVVLALFAGMIDLGMAAYNSMALDSMVRAGTQVALTMKSPSEAAMRNAAERTSALPAGSATVEARLFCECPNPDGTSSPVHNDPTCSTCSFPRRYASVTASQSFTTILPYTGIGKALMLRSQASVRLE